MTEFCRHKFFFSSSSKYSGLNRDCGSCTFLPARVVRLRRRIKSIGFQSMCLGREDAKKIPVCYVHMYVLPLQTFVSSVYFRQTKCTYACIIFSQLNCCCCSVSHGNVRITQSFFVLCTTMRSKFTQSCFFPSLEQKKHFDRRIFSLALSF